MSSENCPLSDSFILNSRQIGPGLALLPQHLKINEQEFLVAQIRNSCRLPKGEFWSFVFEREPQNSANLLLTRELSALPIQIAAAAGFAGLSLETMQIIFDCRQGTRQPEIKHVRRTLQPGKCRTELEIQMVLGSDSLFELRDTEAGATYEIMLTSGDCVLIENELISAMHGVSLVCPHQTFLFRSPFGHLTLIGSFCLKR